MNAPDTPSDPDWPLLASLFDELCDLGDPELDRRLKELAVDPAKGRLVPRLRALLGARSMSESGWEQGAAAVGLKHEDSSDVNAEAGQYIGPWQLLKVLGQGGMGEVWLAERSDAGFTQRVAIKRIRTGIGPELRNRFLRERRILARLKHRHIAAFFDGGEDESGAPWLALEYVEGQRILDYCQANGLGLEARVRLVVQILDALDHAHRLLVVHRDLKPGNVMVDQSGDVKLLDFGIAKLLDDSEAADALTRTRMPAPLTPKYAAPEQLLGEPAGIPADLYSTGILLFELLTGSSPFGATPGLARDQPESLWQVWSRMHAADDLVGRSAKQVRGMLRGDLQRIIDRAIQTLPQDRYPSAAAFGADLSAWLDHRPLLSRPTSLTERTAKWIRRQPLASASLAIAGLAFLLGTAGVLWQSQRATDRANQAEASRRFLSEVFNSADPELRGGEPPTLEELLNRGAERLRLDQGLDSRSRLILLQDLGRASIGLDLLEQADRLLKEAEALADRADLSAEESRALALDLIALDLASDRPDAASQRLNRLVKPDHRLSPTPLDRRELDLRCQALLAASKSQAILDLLAPYRESPHWSSPRLQSELESNTAAALMQMGRPNEGLAAVERALTLLPEDAPLSLRLALHEAEVEALRSTLDNTRALARQKDVITLAESRLGPTHPRSQYARMLLCGLLIGSGELAQADQEYSRLWAQFGAEQGNLSLRAEAMFGWGMVAFRRGEFSLARERFGTSREFYTQVFGESSHRTRNATEAEAMTFVETGDVAAGLATLRLLEQQARDLKDDTRLSATLNSIAVALVSAGRAEEALPLIDESLALAAKLNQATIWTRVIQVRALRSTGQIERAIEKGEGVVAEYRETISPSGGPRRAEAERELALALSESKSKPQDRIRALFDSVLAQRRAFLGEDSPLSQQSIRELDAVMTGELVQSSRK